MTFASRLVELPPRLAWKRGQVLSATLYRRAFRDWGRGSVMVAPLKVRGTDRISVGSECALYGGILLEADGDGPVVTKDAPVGAVVVGVSAKILKNGVEHTPAIREEQQS
ncbi:hypothetical protein J9246_07665 [Micrococcus luteus]|nr:hypothetical protein [Micrococcus luteus]MBS9537664.1 hypothetical protein [Micrococcus luteus]